MNETISRIVEDTQNKLDAVNSLISDTTNEIESLRKLLNRYEAERTELEEVIARLTDEKPKHRVQWFNTDNLTDNYAAPVVVHGEGCNHIKISQRDPYMKAGFEKVSDVEEWESAKQFAKDYNADFYAEAGNEGAWPIAFFPCTGMVERLTITTGYDD